MQYVIKSLHLLLLPADGAVVISGLGTIITNIVVVTSAYGDEGGVGREFI